MKTITLRSIVSCVLSFFMLCALIFTISQCVTTGSLPLFIPRRLPVSTVSVVQAATEKAEDIGYAEIRDLVRESVARAGGLRDLISDGDTVVLKPNLVTVADYTLPGWAGKPLPFKVNGTTTDFRMTKAVVELVREVNPGGKLYVMEGSSVSTEKAFQHFHYTHQDIPGVDEFIAIEKDSGAFKDTDSPGIIMVDVPGGLLHDTYYFNKKFYEADVIISLPCLKTHWHAVMTGAVKNSAIGATPANVYGNAQNSPGRNGMVNHESLALHYWLHDYYMARPADFIIMDGLQGIQNGPTPSFAISGTTDLAEAQMNMRLIIAGRDGVAVDTIASLIMGWDPRSVTYLTLLNKDGVGNMDPASINVSGKRVDEVRRMFKSTVVNKACRGMQIKDTTGPDVVVKAAELDNQGVRVCLESDETDISFVRLRLGEVSFGPVLPRSNSPGGKLFHITINTRDQIPGAGKPTGDEKLIIEAYDIYLNVSHTTMKLPFFAEDTYIAKQAAIPPTIDGKADDLCWKTAVWFPIRYLWLGEEPGPEDFSGEFALSWTEDKLYILTRITDDILRDVHPAPLERYHDDDCLEIFVDEDTSGGEHTYNYNAFAYHVSLSGDVADLHTDKKPLLFNNHIDIAMTTRGSVSTWEAAVSLYDDTFTPGSGAVPVRLETGKQIGFALAYCDNDMGDTRESFIGSLPVEGRDKNRGWIDADVFGSLILME